MTSIVTIVKVEVSFGEFIKPGAISALDSVLY